MPHHGQRTAAGAPRGESVRQGVSPVLTLGLSSPVSALRHPDVAYRHIQ